MSDELSDGPGRNGRTDRKHICDAYDAGTRREVADEVELQVAVERCVAGFGQSGKQQRVAVRGCIDDGFGREIGAAAGAVLDDERLTKSLLQPLSHQPRDDVVAAAGGKSNDPADRP